LDSFLTTEEWSDISTREQITLSNAEINRRAALIRPAA
jgi:hypothetical protein